MKKILIAILLLCGLFIGSCGNKGFLDTVTPKSITDALTDEILGNELYAEYTQKELELIFGNSELYRTASVIYSISSDDIGEVGVFHTDSKDNAKRLLEATLTYIENTKKEKGEFIRSYMPKELDKLNYADARRFGNYIVYTVLSEDISEDVFSAVKELLTE